MSDAPPPTLFDPPAQAWPDWFRPSKYAPAQARLVALGRHPMGGALGSAETSCGACVHLVRNGMRSGRVYLKCALSRQSCGPATDLRAKWRGCEKWTQAPSGAESET